MIQDPAIPRVNDDLAGTPFFGVPYGHIDGLALRAKTFGLLPVLLDSPSTIGRIHMNCFHTNDCTATLLAPAHYILIADFLGNMSSRLHRRFNACGFRRRQETAGLMSPQRGINTAERQQRVM